MRGVLFTILAFLIFFRTRITTHPFHCFMPLQSILLLFSVIITSPIHLAAEQLCPSCRLFYHAVKWEIGLANLFSWTRSDISYHPSLDAFSESFLYPFSAILNFTVLWLRNLKILCQLLYSMRTVQCTLCRPLYPLVKSETGLPPKDLFFTLRQR